MRAALLMAAITAVLFTNVSLSHATEGPWCSWVGIGGHTGVENCSWSSLEVCRQEVIAGNKGTCYPNPHLANGYGAVRSRRSHYSHY
jgi:hypothetical protein